MKNLDARSFIDNLVGAEKYDVVYKFSKESTNYYIGSVDGEMTIWAHEPKTGKLDSLGDYYSIWVRGRINAEEKFIYAVEQIAPLDQWTEETMDINHL